MNVENQSILCMSHIPGLGSKRIMAILHHIGDQNWWKCPQRDFLAVPGIGEETARNIVMLRAKLDPIRIQDTLKQHGIHFFTQADTMYPKSLCMLSDPPLYVFIKGMIHAQDQTAIAIVGTRKPTYYGVKAATYLSEQAAELGITVVSGLARGIDKAAHASAVASEGRTIAVLAHGLDHIYPREHARLAEKICQNGALLSEYPPGIQARPQNFTARNRLISGLSLCTLVVEAGAKSGALITAQFALEQGKEVLAVPGSIFDNTSMGTNTLIYEGATPVRTFDDVMQALNGENWIAQNFQMQYAKKTAMNKQICHAYDTLEHDLQKMIETIPATGIPMNDLVNLNLNLSLSELHLKILKLEIAGFLVKKGDRVFRTNGHV